MITQEELKDIAIYNPDTGIFTWSKTRCPKVIKGRECGYTADDRYVRIMVLGNLNFAHRLAFVYMTGHPPNCQVDHINGVRNDNRWVNLRDVTSTENNRNKRIHKNNTSGVSGVTFSNASDKWHATIYVNGKSKSLGLHSEFNDAVKARRDAESIGGYHKNHGNCLAADVC